MEKIESPTICARVCDGVVNALCETEEGYDAAIEFKVFLEGKSMLLNSKQWELIDFLLEQVWAGNGAVVSACLGGAREAFEKKSQAPGDEPNKRSHEHIGKRRK